MNATVDIDDAALASLASVTVTYHPDLARLDAQLSRLPAGILRVVVDNASPDATRVALRERCAAAGIVFIALDENVGLPAAINRGLVAARAARDGIGHALLLDQDTVPADGAVAALFAAWQTLAQAHGARVQVGPALVDDDTGIAHGFHRIAGWRWQRVMPRAGEATPVACDSLNCSGTLLPLSLADELGALDESLFLDHLDTEWSFRARAAGARLFGLPRITASHRMGQRGLRVWLGGWRVWPYRAPMRHALLFRNAIWLMRRAYVPRIWKAWAIAKLVATFAGHALFDRDRVAQCRAMVRGVREGVTASRDACSGRFGRSH